MICRESTSRLGGSSKPLVIERFEVDCAEQTSEEVELRFKIDDGESYDMRLTVDRGSLTSLVSNLDEFLQHIEEEIGERDSGD